ncbi:MAG TPA: LysR substrate-binding domain-containing protein [Burkholderiales bacterium]|nr:LysR substrate-binding domain-containing protein [Burkholderiales bacterium]
MRISLDALLVLDSIARNGSFAAAGEELHRVPSAITYTIQKLEQDLDVQLFDRSGHRARLTEAGEALLREGRHLLRTATDLECRVKHVATGWESELRIAVDDLVPIERLFPLLKDFYREQSGTRIRLSTEVLGGCWDALIGGRADMVIGAPGDAPPEGLLAVEPIGSFEFVFVVSPDHPLATAKEPLAAQEIRQHRAISAADTSRTLPPRTSGLLDGQDSLTVPTIRAKAAAQIAGLGAVYLPMLWAAPHIAAGRLVKKDIEGSKALTHVYLAWHPRQAGKAGKWFIDRLRDKSVQQYVLGESGSYPAATG